MRKPKSIFIVLDSLDGPHLFPSLKKAYKIMKQWEKEAEVKDHNRDSYWDMSNILEYKFKQEHDHKND